MHQTYWYNKASKEEEYFGKDNTAKTSRDNYIKLGSHEKPRDEKIFSKKSEIYKNIVLILIDQGKSNEAKGAIEDARKANPNDTSLMIAEADFYLKEKDYANYTRVVNEALEKDSNNVDLIFNLSVISADSNNLQDAEKHYKKAIEIDPNYFNAYLNLAELKLRANKDFVDAMKKLGTKPEVTRFKGLGEISPNEFAQFIGPDMRKMLMRVEERDHIQHLLEYYMDKNKPDSQVIIIPFWAFSASLFETF